MRVEKGCDADPCRVCSYRCATKVQLIGEQYGTIKEMMGTLAEDMQIIKLDIEFMKGSSVFY